MHNLIKKISILFFLFCVTVFPSSIIRSEEKIKSNYLIKNGLYPKKDNSSLNNKKIDLGNHKNYEGKINWQLIDKTKDRSQDGPKIEWKKINENSTFNQFYKANTKKSQTVVEINSLNRSLVFNNKIFGPDISWIVPPGFKWNRIKKFDISVRGHSRRNPGDQFLNWNGGDAVGQFYYQIIEKENQSFGINYGVRSVYQGDAAGGATPFGEGASLGFRWDRKLSDYSGFSLGGEQLIHFDGKTDTGRDLYLTYSKAFWYENLDGIFPLNVITAGFGTGKLAEGNIKGLCSDLLGGSGTEILHQRRLCWAPIFSLSRVYNNRYSNFLEYNSKEFILGASLAPSKKLPLRGTFAITIADHIDNYKLKNFNELRWVFRLSLGL